ncbi:hypothetical protein [uncultured Dubosiella sp.]|uniref:hypothetical protein n=1 Tax=uncultured Dubosiella sp. TaxID=1937011 RepID=UPI0025B50DF9|nr:hypothetical protein [uncultured Dubosiella sp.]
MEARILDAIQIEDWTTRAEILRRLQAAGIPMSDRAFRKWVSDVNEEFYDGVSDVYIAHGDKGYKITKDSAEIIESVADLKRRAMDMLVKHKKARRALARRMQTPLFKE